MTKSFKIEKIHGAPAAIMGRGRKSIYPFLEMEIGDSFFVEKDDAIKARLAASQWKRLHQPWNYTTRQEADGIRIWRIA